MKTFLFHLAIINCITQAAIYYNMYIILLVPFILLIKVFSLSIKDGLLILSITIIMSIYFQINLQAPKILNKEFIVTKIQKKSYIIKNKEGKSLLYTDTKLNLNDKIIVDKPLKEVSSIENLNLFNYKDYLKTKKVFYEVKQKQVKIIYKNKKDKDSTKINSYYDYLYFQDSNDIDDTIKEALAQLAIIHLVVVSGFHFNIFYKIINITLIFIKSIKIKTIISLFLLLIYLYMLDFSAPALRAFLSIAFKNNKHTIKLDAHNQLGLCAFITMLINPLNIISTSFQLTYLVSLIIINIPNHLKERPLLFNLIISIGTSPLISNMNYQISMTSFLLSTIFTPIIILIYIIIFLAQHFAFINELGLTTINIFEKTIISLNQYNPILHTGYYSFIIALIFYILFFIFLIKFNKHYKYIIFPLMYILIYSYLPTFSGIITYLNVGQGDCIIIKPPNSKKAMMIDVAQSYKQENVKRIIIPYLKSIKVDTIDKLVITHDDKDHSGGKDDLIKYFKVNEVIEKKQQYIKFNNYLFTDILANTQFKDKNKNSITLYTRINGLNYLFTGDIDIEAEQEFNKYVNKLPVDILKVAHHGSKTSSSESFLFLTNPKVAIAQVKKDNHYNHPHPMIIKRFKDHNIDFLSTAQNGSIQIRYGIGYNYIKKYK